MHADFPLTRDLVLIGGGHSHALVLRMWGMKPLPGVRVTMINPGPVAAYSGMLPGHVAGHYTEEELELDLVKLARFAGTRLIMERAVAMDPDARRVILESGREVAFDVASIDIGIHSEMPAIKGFSTFAVAAKPLDQFAKRWRAHLADLRAGDKNGSVAVIGGGVAGVELALTMAHAVKDAGQNPKITVIDRSEPLKGVNAAARTKLLKALAAAGGAVMSGAEVAEIGENSVTLANGRKIDAALCVGVAGAVPHGFNAASGLSLEAAFIRVDKHLQAEGRAGIFAAGDCAHMVETPRPKAGVFAVRAAPVLFANLRAALTGGALRAFKPQKNYLKLVSLGPKSALAERGRWAFSGPLLWLWKDRIDRKFMAMLKDLPAMANVDIPVEKALGLSEMLAEKPLCGGCGAKVGPGVLNEGLCRLPAIARPDVISGPGDDAAVLDVGGVRQVLTTDHLRAFTNDPVAMTRITILHAMGDVWAMGAEPQAALLSLILPRQSEAMQARIMAEILSAANDLLRETGAALVGGHTTMGSEMTIGVTLTGLAGERVIGVDGAQEGDVLILTRPLGSGILLAAEMQGAANGKDVAQLLEIMQQSQGEAAKILRPFATAMTDVTGFGLAGHLRAMAKGSGLAATLNTKEIAVYQGVRELVAKGHGSALTKANRAAAPVAGAEALGWMAEVLHDPQTAGGFLAAVPAERADQLILDLKSVGYPVSCVGHLEAGEAGRITAS